jgi:hypothetical protein
MAVVIMIVRVAMIVPVSMALPGAMTRVLMPRFDFVPRSACRCRRACRGIVPVGARTIALRQRAPRQKNLDHGRILPKVTESLNSL